ncbi:hypothetical protein ACE6H2_014750 [Prunus campanulata]
MVALHCCCSHVLHFTPQLPKNWKYQGNYDLDMHWNCDTNPKIFGGALKHLVTKLLPTLAL